jgi:hypothetical protein
LVRAAQATHRGGASGRVAHHLPHAVEQVPVSIDSRIVEGQSLDMRETLLFSQMHLVQQQVGIGMGTRHSRTEQSERVDHLAHQVVKGVGKSLRLRGHAKPSLRGRRPARH